MAEQIYSEPFISKEMQLSFCTSQSFHLALLIIPQETQAQQLLCPVSVH